MKNIFLILIVLLLGLPLAAFAQTACPVGVAPGSPQCGPDSGTSRANEAPPQPTGEWIKTWGAIAGSDSTGEAGTAANKISQTEAEEAAIRQCEIGGAGDCKIDLVYRNQCAALVSGDSGSFFQASPTEQRAIEIAKRKCAKNGGGSCKVVYSECTSPIFRKY
ncbi:DUF4189 domain-containing protein [Xanthomonas vesicatoria]|uniref:DUF4189 domain-containing protein n=1 Tax=Xanthomonas vesicatoria TaxID=56460 RepID=UPI0009387A07|nr:DUF4189 domain-containing protein [Xanthomonas vesicatoria]APP74566.1 hypothetical protein BJD12_04075 [Xanthomonas vesicatoria ATCC 35937]MCC8556859.1 DUF4189 domain-containing protein [Xanthomonas vesicatoria]MCC8596141.1 DUF4189 domain-containing protein [Xanthomonas vesicatoria]MCC8600599.1 DUF4189 domain-containing protein [Xanthomonas vesicatoria]MCC8603570.1 DUF4189 domain-containing protein [Xanthomonas vesicatoria]